MRITIQAVEDVMTISRGELVAATVDCATWYGIPFNDLDCRHWLPYLTAEDIGQDSPKLTIEQDYSTEWTLPEAPNEPGKAAA